MPSPLADHLRAAVDARRTGHFDESAHLLHEAAALCGPHQLLERAYVLREQGELARATGHPDAQSHYEQAVHLLRSAGDPLKLAHTLRHLGDVRAEKHQAASAAASYAEALQIYRSHPAPPPLQLANALRAYALQLSPDDARPLWLEAAALYEAEGITAGADESRRRAGEPSP